MFKDENNTAQTQGEPNVVLLGGRDSGLGLSQCAGKLYHDVIAQLPLPGIVIFVHGVNSDGEWYQEGEKGLCKGLNTRLGREEGQIDHPNIDGGQLTPVSYMSDLTPDGYLNPDKDFKTLIENESHFSPVIQFRWGYKASAEDLQTFGDAIFLNEKDYWGGGPFANGCSSLPDLWEEGLNDQLFLWLHAQHINPTNDRMVYACPHRGYYIVAALRLAKLIGEIRKKQADVPVTIVCHSQGNMVSLAAAFLGDRLDKVTDCSGNTGNCVANTYVLCNPPYSLLDGNFVEGWTQLTTGSEETGFGRQTYEARVGTLKNFFEIMRQQAQGHAMAQPAAYVDKFMTNENHKFSAETDREGRGFGSDQKKTNYGRVTLYFNPHDQVISASPVQGIGWRGMSATEIRHTEGSDVFCQRVFAQGFPVGKEPEKDYAQYDFWKNHHVKDENGGNLKPGDKRFWYPESPCAEYSIGKGLDANKDFIAKVLTVVGAPIFYIVFKVGRIRINGLPVEKENGKDKGWVTPLQAPRLPTPFKPRSKRFGNTSEQFDEWIDAQGSSRNAEKKRDTDDPYAGEHLLPVDSLNPDKPRQTDKAMGKSGDETSLLYEHHAYLRMRARREGLDKKPNIKLREDGTPANEEDDLDSASESYKDWRTKKIKMILADTVNTPATDHSTILTNSEHSEKALAYDIPIGVCHIPKEDLADLRKMADWRYLGGLEKSNPIAEFGQYFKRGLMDRKKVADWAQNNEMAKMPKKIINRRSFI